MASKLPLFLNSHWKFSSVREKSELTMSVLNKRFSIQVKPFANSLYKSMAFKLSSQCYLLTDMNFVVAVSTLY